MPRPVPPHNGRFKLDHDNIHYHAPAVDDQDQGGSLHSPRLDANPAKAVCRLLTVVFELASVGPGEGGFVRCAPCPLPLPPAVTTTAAQGCLAGSHKDCVLPTHDQWKQRWATAELRGPEWPAETPPVHRVEGAAGDAIIFTEKLVQ